MPHWRKRRFQEPYSAKDSRAFQSWGRSRAMRDWVMVCSSTLRASPVTHWTKRCLPRWVKPRAMDRTMACHSGQSQVAFIAHLLGGLGTAVATVTVSLGGVLVHHSPSRARARRLAQTLIFSEKPLFSW